MGPDALDERQRKIRADLEAQFALKKECERRALEVVHQMLETPSVGENEMKNSAILINPDFYQDIVIERGIVNLCGYPLCPNELSSKMAKQKYHVSTVTNTVFDITERVNFCSNYCFKASKYYASQVPSDPLWTRKTDEPLHISLLSRDEATPMKTDAAFAGAEIPLSSPSTMGLNRSSETESSEITKHPETDVKKLPGIGSNSERKDNEKTHKGVTLEKYRSLVGEAKLEMIKHLLFDKESVLEEKLVEQEKKKMNEGKVEETSDVEHSQDMSALSCADSKSVEYPIILERNLEHDLSSLTIADDSGKTNNANGCTSGDIEKTTDDNTEDHFFDQIAIETAMNQRLVKERQLSTDERFPNRGEPCPSSKRVSFSDKVQYSDKKESCSYSETKSSISSRSIMSTPPTLSVGSPIPKIPGVEHVASNSSSASKRQPSPRNQSRSAKTPPAHPLDPIWRVFHSWTTRMTVVYLWSERLHLSEELQKQKLEEKVGNIIERVEKEESSSVQQIDISRDVINADCKPKPPRKRPVPDFNRLKTDQAMNEEKVVEFFKASFKLPTSVEIVEGQGVEDDANGKKEKIFLPPTDRLSQLAIRRKLVLDRLLVVLPDILSTVELTIEQVLDDVKAIIETLNLGCDTIILRPGQWAVAAVMLLKMASIRNAVIWERIHDWKSCDILSKALDEIGIRLEDVDNLVATLTNLQLLQEEKRNS